MNIKIKSLELKNFKGIKVIKIDFGENTNIYGTNASGKTTLEDAFMWGLFGKDSQGNADFNIKTLDIEGNVINGIDHTVAIILSVDGKDIKLTRTLKEKWTKKRGLADKVFEGNTTIYEIDDVPVPLKEYKEKVDSILKEDMFKLVTNPAYFPSLSWIDQRRIVFDVIGNLDNENVINYNDKLKPLENLLDDGAEDFIKKVKAKITKIKSQLKSIPERIDECNNSIVDINCDELISRKTKVENRIGALEDEIEGIRANNNIFNSKSKELYNTRMEYENAKIRSMQNIDAPKRKIQSEIQDIEHDIEDLRRKINSTEKHIFDLNKIGEDLTKERNKLREHFDEVSSKEFAFDTNLVCPTCGKEYTEEEKDEIYNKEAGNFDTKKAKELDSIRNKGIRLNVEIKSKKNSIESLELEIHEIKKKINSLNNLLEVKKESLNNITPVAAVVGNEKEFKAKIAKLGKEIESITSGDNTNLKSERKELKIELEKINKELASKDHNERMKNRIEELKEEERELSNQVAELEGQQYLGEEFVKTKIELLESELNKKFGDVKFVLFKPLNNGGLDEKCEISVGGVPYKDLNNAMKINSGIKVINVLCEHYGINAPIWIDNAESVNKIVDTNSQIIKLVVSEDKKLKVEVK